MATEFNDHMMDGEALRRRCDQLMSEFEDRHPAKARANKFVNGLVDASHEPVDATRADRERALAGAELFVRYGILSNLFESASIELEECIFDLLTKIMRATYELGIRAAPDGRSARAAREGSGDSRFIELVQAVTIYCQEPGIEPKASEKFANIIRPDILELLGLPKDAKRPAVSALVTALRAIRKSSLIL